MEQPFPGDQPALGAQYWRCLYEFKRRRFSFAQRRLCEAILDLSIGEGFTDVEIPSLGWLAEATFITPNNLHPVIRQLTEANVLGREPRLKTWWLNEIGLWKRLRSDDDIADPERSTRANQAMQDILRHNRLRSSQSELFPLPTTDAEVAADGHQARAADWSATGLPSAVAAPPSLAETVASDGLKIRWESLKNRLSESKIQTPESEKKTLAIPLLAGTPAGARPGFLVNTNQEIPGKPGKDKPATSRWQLDYAGWSLFRDLEAFCVAGGDDPFSPDHARQWQWRIWRHPLRVEMGLRETMAHVREGRRPLIRRRAGWMKHLWTLEEKQDAAPKTPEETALAQRVREEAAKHFGSTIQS